MRRHLNENERTVLEALANDLDCGYAYSSFARIIDNTIRLDRKQVRRACRSLAKKGFAEYRRGLWSDEGIPAGSGYGATTAGADALKTV